MKKKKNGVGDPIKEELSNSDNSIVNHNNIFYPSNLSANDAGEAKTGVSKERNVLYLKNGGGKIRMEGMYGITKMRDVNGNELGSHSDLLEDIGLSNDDGDIDNGTENEVVLPDSDIMFPLDSSLSENSHNEKKGSRKRKNGNTKVGESIDKAQFCISDSSYEFDDKDSKLSPDKNKNGVERKNTNYFTGTNLSSIDNHDFKSSEKKNLFKNLTALKNSKVEELDAMKLPPGVSTKISSKIEGDSKFNPKDANKKLDDKLSKIKDFNIKNVLFAQFTKRINDLKDKDPDKSEVISDNQEDDETEEKKKDKIELNANSAELEDMEANEIQVVKKGMKIKVMKETKFDELKNTPYEDIIVNKNDTEDNYHYHKHYIEEIPPKTTVKPYHLSREMVLNEILLEGKVDDEEEEDENEEKKPEESKTPDALNKSVDEEDAQSEDKNLYLEKFKYFHRSNVIATGTISIVLTLRSTARVFDIPNPCAESYGAIIIDDESSEIEEEEIKSRVVDKQPLRRNETLLPGVLMRQNTNTSKGIGRKSKIARRMIANKNTMKKRARDEEEYSEENVLKKLILDIPADSAFSDKVDKEKFKREQEEDDKLDEGEDENEEDIYKESEDEMEDITDIFLDREIDFEKEIENARKTSAKLSKDSVEWSGQDIKIDYDPYYAKIAATQMSTMRVFPYGFIGSIILVRGWLAAFVLSGFFENLMTVAVAINTIVLALDHHGISKNQEAILTTMNSYFTYIFISEMSLKLIGQGPLEYLRDKMNYLDGMVVMLSVFELAFLSGGGALSAFRAVRIMRTFRVLRVARLLKSMQSMQTIIDVIGRSISSFLYLALLLLLF